MTVADLLPGQRVEATVTVLGQPPFHAEVLKWADGQTISVLTEGGVMYVRRQPGLGHWTLGGMKVTLEAN